MNKNLFLATLLVAIPIAGCAAPAQNNANTAEADPTPVVESTPNDKKTDTKPAAADDNARDPHYKVQSEADARMPSGLIATLRKLQVPPPPAKMIVPEKARVRFLTSKGAITVELNGKEAPLAVKNFLYLSKRGFYDDTVFHRYEPGFVIQGGDPLTKDSKNAEYFGIGGPGYQVPREHNKLKHEKYVIAAARSQDPDSAGSQFYFTLEATPFLDEGEGYTVFGKVLDGQANVAKLRKGDKLNKVVIVPAAPVKKPVTKPAKS